MKRLLAFIVLLIATAIGLCWPLGASWDSGSGSSSATDPVVITDYKADYVVGADGKLTATETLTTKFPLAPSKHGIFRYWDLNDPADAGVRYTPKLQSITLDGKTVPYTTLSESGGRFFVAKIGDPKTFVAPGSHVYSLTYAIDGVISPISAGQGKEFVSAQGSEAAGSQSDFYWNVVAQGWEMAIQQATIKIALPHTTGQVQCTAGAPAVKGFVQGPCQIAGAGTAQLTLTATGIPPRSGMTVRATMAPPPPPRASVPWGIAWDEILGSNPTLVGVIVLVSLATAGIGLFFALRARESTPGLPVMYGPPEGLGPVQTVFIDTEAPGAHALTSSLYYLADRNLVKLELREDKSWLVTGQAGPEQWAGVDPVTRGVAEDLGVTYPGYWFLADKSVSAGKTLQTANSRVAANATAWAKAQGLVRTEAAERIAKAMWVVCFLLAIGGFTGIVGPTMLGLPFAGFVLGGFGLMQTGVGMRRTAQGRRAWSEAGGFKRLLATDSSEARFDFSARKDLFIAFIPFAVAFGVADKWASKYKVATGEEPPWPMWYPYAYGMAWGSAFSGGGVDSFESALNSSIGAYTASQSSSSGGGGGGFGGGGGGGGGGSW